MATNTPDLTKQAPRSPRVRLGGYSILPRLLDKGRATLTGKNGEYHYACPNDQHFLTFAGIDPDALRKQLAAGMGDGEILEWISANAKFKRSAAEIESWSAWMDRRAPDNLESRKHFNDVHSKVAPNRKDIISWADLLDLDDYVSFGGKA